MTLTTHAIVGTAAMTATVSAFGITPAGITLGIAAGFASHFAVDSIPHWNESTLLRSIAKDPSDRLATDMRLGKDFLRDLVVLAVDAGLGVSLSLFIFSFWLFHLPPPLVITGAAAGIAPDPLQFVYFKTRWRLMRPLQSFHAHIQTELASLFAIGIEAALIMLVVAGLKLFI